MENTLLISSNSSFNFKTFDEEDEKDTFPSAILDELNIPKNEPDWKFITYTWLPEEAHDYFIKSQHRIYSYSTYCFYQGIRYEYGIKTRINKQKALFFYIKSGSMNNYLALYRLFFIFCSKSISIQFNLKRDIDFGILCLIKSICYIDITMEINKVDPVLNLLPIIKTYDIDHIKIVSLLVKMRKNQILPYEESEVWFLSLYLKLNFSSSITNFKNTFEKLEKLALERRHFEICYKIASIYSNPPNDIFNKNEKVTFDLFAYLRKVKYWKSYFSFTKFLEENKKEWSKYFSIDIYKEVKNFNIQFYCNKISENKQEIYLNSGVILNNSFNFFITGSIISIVICFEIISKIILKTNGVFLNEMNDFYLKIIFDFCQIDKRKWVMTYIDYDVYVLFYIIQSYFYFKGIIVKKDINKAIEILETSFEDKKSIKNYRKALYYLSKYYKIIGKTDVSEYFMFKSLKIYLLSCEFPYHFYILGRIFMKGIENYLLKDKEFALVCFKEGGYYNDNSYLINSLYSKKCQDFLVKNLNYDIEKDNDYIIDDYFINNDDNSKEKEKDSERTKKKKENHQKFLKLKASIQEKYIDDNEICILCFSNFRQIIFTPCGHKNICYLCFEKLNPKKVFVDLKCPYCNKKDSGFINDFHI